jgi:hypothetical protein
MFENPISVCFWIPIHTISFIEWASAQVPPTFLYLGGALWGERERDREGEGEGEMDGWMDR